MNIVHFRKSKVPVYVQFKQIHNCHYLRTRRYGTRIPDVCNKTRDV